MHDDAIRRMIYPSAAAGDLVRTRPQTRAPDRQKRSTDTGAGTTRANGPRRPDWVDKSAPNRHRQAETTHWPYRSLVRSTKYLFIFVRFSSVLQRAIHFAGVVLLFIFIRLFIYACTLHVGIAAAINSSPMHLSTI